jgi:disulfide oxidoreductase YuzD
MRFGEAVQVEYVDLADPGMQVEYSDLVTTAEESNIPYPWVAINGQLRLAGSAHYYNVLPHVEELLQEKDLVADTQ